MSAPSLTPTKTDPARRTLPRRAGPPPSRDRFTRSLRRNLTAHAFLIGAVVCFAVFSWYPMVREFGLAFQKTESGHTRWVGLDNLTTVVNDPAFWQAWRNTALFTVLALVFGFAAPFVAALVINEFRHGQAYLRLLVYLPVMLPPSPRCCCSSTSTTPGTACSTRCCGSCTCPSSSGCRTRTSPCCPS